jgi:hypothetical protein
MFKDKPLNSIISYIVTSVILLAGISLTVYRFL